MVPNSSKLEPMLPPEPALFSNKSGTVSEAASASPNCGLDPRQRLVQAVAHVTADVRDDAGCVEQVACLQLEFKRHHRHCRNYPAWASRC